MDKKELLIMVEAVSNEKNILKNDVFQGLELGLALATNKQHGEGHVVEIDQESGEWKTQDEDGMLVENIIVGRINGQVVKNCLFQHVKNVSEKYKVQKMMAKLGTVVNCKIHRINKGSYVCIVNDDEFIMPFRECISKEKFRVGDIVSVVVKCSEKNGKENIYLSRLDEALVVEMLGMEVPEIGEGSIEVVACSRVPGFKSKIVVYAKDSRLDAVGMCIGMKGMRVKAISEELGGEFIEIMPWMEDAGEMINCVVDGDVEVEVVLGENSCTVIAEDENLGMAIGRGGINVDLIQKMVGVKTKVVGKIEQAEIMGKQKTIMTEDIVAKIGVSEVEAGKLVSFGLDSIEKISEAEANEIGNKIGVSDSEMDVIIENALDFMLIDVMQKSEKWDSLQDIINDDEIIEVFSECGLRDVSDVADLSVFELKDLVGMDDEWCGEVIMSSRRVEGVV